MRPVSFLSIDSLEWRWVSSSKWVIAVGSRQTAAKRRDDDRRRRVWVERSCHQEARVGTWVAGAENLPGDVGGAGGRKEKLLPRLSVPDLFNALRISRPIHNTRSRSAACTKILGPTRSSTLGHTIEVLSLPQRKFNRSPLAFLHSPGMAMTG